jgi:hypothetical protein
MRETLVQLRREFIAADAVLAAIMASDNTARAFDFSTAQKEERR